MEKKERTQPFKAKDKRVKQEWLTKKVKWAQRDNVNSFQRWNWFEIVQLKMIQTTKKWVNTSFE